MLTRRAAVALVTLSAMGLTACGTTVRHHHATSSVGAGNELSAVGGSTGDGSTTGSTGTDGSAPADGSGGDSSAPATTDTSTGGATGGTSGTTGTGSSTTGSVSSTTGGTKVATPTKAGATKAGATKAGATKAAATKAGAVPTGKATGSAVSVGIAYFGDLNAAAGTFGGTADAGDQQVQSQAVVDYINAHGGLYGHVLAPDFYKFNLLDPSPYSTSEAAICSSWTQDHHDIAGMFVGAAVPDDLASCMQQKGVLYISDGGYMHDASTYQQLPYLISPSEAGPDRAFKALVPQLLSSGFITKKDKVGVLITDNEASSVRTYNNIIVPTLKAAGVSVTSYAVSYASSTAALVNKEQQVSNAETHAQLDGITKMMFLAPGTAGDFIKDAHQQKFLPKYAFTSYDSVQGLATSTDPSTADLAGSVGIGWEPVVDVGTYANPNIDGGNKTRTLCRSIIDPTGQNTGDLSELAVEVFCNALLSLQAAASTAHVPTVTSASLLAGYKAMGTSYLSAASLASQWNPDRHDAAAAYRTFSYDSSKKAFTYTSGNTAF